jgi:hypothetical protein
LDQKKKKKDFLSKSDLDEKSIAAATKVQNDKRVTIKLFWA